MCSLSGNGSPLSPRSRAILLLPAITTVVVLGSMVWPVVLVTLGVNVTGYWFLDSHAVLAACDAMRAGLQLDQANPLDLLRRPHVYSDWWLGLRHLGLTREHNLLLGGSWVLGFLAVAWWTLRPKTVREALVFTLVLIAPTTLLAIDRANNDLVIFAVLGLGAIGVSRWPRGAWLAGAAAIGIATGLKYYPAVAVLMLLVLRPLNRMLLALAFATVAVALALLNVWPAIPRGNFPLPPSLYTFGSPILLTDLGYTGGIARAVGASLIALGAGWLVYSGRTSGLLDERGDFDRRLLFVLGAALLVGCFLAGGSYGYRCIFAAWVAPWLVDEAFGPVSSNSCRSSARVTLGLLVFNLWADGLYCIAMNLALELPPDQIRSLQLNWQSTWQLGWRLVSQPFAWLLIAFLAGWLLQLGLGTLSEIRAAWRERNVAGFTPGGE